MIKTNRAGNSGSIFIFCDLYVGVVTGVSVGVGVGVGVSVGVEVAVGVDVEVGVAQVREYVADPNNW